MSGIRPEDATVVVVEDGDQFMHLPLFIRFGAIPPGREEILHLIETTPEDVHGAF